MPFDINNLQDVILKCLPFSEHWRISSTYRGAPLLQVRMSVKLSKNYP